MGGEFSGIRTEEDFLKEFDEIRRESDIHFGSVIIFKNKKNPKFNVLVKEKIILSNEDLNAFIEQSRLRSNLKAKNIAPLVEIFVHTDKKLCSTTYRAMIGFEFHERTLEKLLRQMISYENEDAQMMSEVDAWGVLTDLSCALRAYRERGINHGDIQPACIFVLNDKTLKLVDSCFMADVNSAYDRRYHDCSYKSPLSPQAISSLTLGPKYATFDKERNDVWALGITMLVSLTNEDYNIFYDWHNQEILYELILSRLRRIQSMGYSQDFIQALKLMLEKDENRRVGISTLTDFINRASKPVYVSELQDLSINQDDGAYNNYPAQNIQASPNYSSNPRSLQDQYTSNQMHKSLATDVYGNPIPTEHGLNKSYSPRYENRATAPMMFGHHHPSDLQAESPQTRARGGSPLQSRFGHNFGVQQSQSPQLQVLRDIGNVANVWGQEQRFQAGKGSNHRGQAMSHRQPISNAKHNLQRLDSNPWGHRFTNLN